MTSIEAVMNAISVDGSTMAVPFDNHGWLLWYNTKLMEDAGLDPERTARTTAMSSSNGRRS